MSRQTMIVSAALVAVLTLSLTSTAHAKRGGPMLITYGDNVTHLGDVAPEHQEEIFATAGPSAKVGLWHNEFGLFWMNIWTWSPEYVVYDDNNNVYELEDKAHAADLMGVEESAITTPWTYTFPPGLLIIIGLIVLYIGYKVLQSRTA